MKIKLFEEFTEYNIGDYVLLSENNFWRVNVAKITNKKNKSFTILYYNVFS